MINYTAIDLRGLQPDFLSGRAWNRAAKAAFDEVGDYWHEKVLPRHFKPFASRKYKHKKRTKAYLKRKDREKARGRARAGSDVDNVFTGATQDALQRFRIVRAMPTRATVQMVGPPYLRTNFKMKQPNKPREITTVTAAEEAQIATVFGRALERAIESEKQRARK